MFGESSSESPRLPSPWLALSPSPSPAHTSPSLLPTTPSPQIRPLPIHASLSDEFSSLSISPYSLDGPLNAREEQELEGSGAVVMPRLVPEVEEGNIEYKLKLIAPSVDRFARLVTQLKWRLLEGGGQAIYEIGVADSGQLVGLTAYELEESLATLERMADDLGATVLISRAIEVPVLQSRIDGAGRVPPFPTPSPSPPPSGTHTKVVHRENTHTPLAIASRTRSKEEKEAKAAKEAKGANKRRAARKMQVKARKREMLAGSQPKREPREQVKSSQKGKYVMKEKDVGLAVPARVLADEDGEIVKADPEAPETEINSKPLSDDTTDATSDLGLAGSPIASPRISPQEDPKVSPSPSPSPSSSRSCDAKDDDDDEEDTDETDDGGRWIVEALVLRKLDAEQGEGFLDFEGFGVE